MSKLGKFCIKTLILGIIMTIIGTVILAVEALNGFIDDIPSLDIDNNAHSAEYVGYEVTTVTEVHPTEETMTDVIDQGTYTGSEFFDGLNVSPEEVHELDISISTGSFDIVPGDSFRLFANGINPDYLKFELNDNCLEVKYSPDTDIFSLDWMSFAYSPEITLYVPFKTYEKISLNMSAGTASINEITANDFVFDMSAGNAYLGNVIAYNSSDIKMSAGNAVFTDCIFTDSNKIQVSAGEMVFENCSLTGGNYVKVTAGNLQMYLNGNSAYYDISANKSTGTLYINDKEVNNSYSSASTLEYPLSTMNVDVRAGTCYITFNED